MPQSSLYFFYQNFIFQSGTTTTLPIGQKFQDFCLFGKSLRHCLTKTMSYVLWSSLWAAKTWHGACAIEFLRKRSSCYIDSSEARVTRLGESSPIGRFGNFLKFFKKSSTHFLATLSPVKVKRSVWQKWLWLHYGLFFTNSSGHPVWGKAFLFFRRIMAFLE
jgi:hypothetical protein